MRNGVIPGAAGVRKRRFILGALHGALALASGCSSVDLPASSSVSARGAQATAIRRIGPWFRVTTISIIPGRNAIQHEPWTVRRCGSPALQVELSSAHSLQLSNETLGELCDQVRTGISTVMDGLPDPPGRYVFRAVLVPAGVAVRTKKSGWATSDSAIAEFVFPWNSDEKFARANLVSTSAHESFHLLGALAGLPAQIRTDEDRAYLLGTCAQFISLGYVRAIDLPKGAYSSGNAGAHAQIVASSQAGLSLRNKLEPFFDSDGEITPTSTGGVALLARCRSER